MINSIDLIYCPNCKAASTEWPVLARSGNSIIYQCTYPTCKKPFIVRVQDLRGLANGRGTNTVSGDIVDAH